MLLAAERLNPDIPGYISLAYPQNALGAIGDTSAFMVYLVLQTLNSQNQGWIQNQLKSGEYFSLLEWLLNQESGLEIAWKDMLSEVPNTIIAIKMSIFSNSHNETASDLSHFPEDLRTDIYLNWEFQNCSILV